jgi:hypothetical protein
MLFAKQSQNPGEYNKINGGSSHASFSTYARTVFYNETT